MNVYDFDKTIYAGDSTVDFYLFCLKKYPHIGLSLPKQVFGVFLYAIHKIDRAGLKEYFFSFLKRLTVSEQLLDAFWNVHAGKIQSWYLRKKCYTDVIISASPEFLLKPICKKLGVSEPIATQVDPCTGKLMGANCKGEEKVRRFLSQYPSGEITLFYSDSLTDTPMAGLARQAVKVKGARLYPWPVIGQ